MSAERLLTSPYTYGELVEKGFLPQPSADTKEAVERERYGDTISMSETQQARDGTNRSAGRVMVTSRDDDAPRWPPEVATTSTATSTPFGERTYEGVMVLKVPRSRSGRGEASAATQSDKATVQRSEVGQEQDSRLRKLARGLLSSIGLMRPLIKKLAPRHAPRHYLSDVSKKSPERLKIRAVALTALGAIAVGALASPLSDAVHHRSPHHSVVQVATPSSRPRVISEADNKKADTPEVSRETNGAETATPLQTTQGASGDTVSDPPHPPYPPEDGQPIPVEPNDGLIRFIEKWGRFNGRHWTLQNANDIYYNSVRGKIPPNDLVAINGHEGVIPSPCGCGEAWLDDVGTGVAKPGLDRLLRNIPDVPPPPGLGTPAPGDGPGSCANGGPQPCK